MREPKKTYKRPCIVCGKKPTVRMWVNGAAYGDPVCSEICFVKAYALFGPTETARARARARLLELGVPESEI